MSEHHFHDPVIESRPLVGTTATLVRFAGGDGSDAWGFHHECSSWSDEQEPDGVFVKVVAPRLTNHTMTLGETGMTVRASILCPDCGVHGFITDDRWEGA